MQYERLLSERSALKMQLGGLQEDLRIARAMIDEERATVSMQVRAAQARDDDMSESVRGMHADNEALKHQVCDTYQHMKAGK